MNTNYEIYALTCNTIRNRLKTDIRGYVKVKVIEQIKIGMKKCLMNRHFYNFDIREENNDYSERV